MGVASVDDGVVLARTETRAGPGPKCMNDTDATVDTIVWPSLTIVVGTLVWIDIPDAILKTLSEAAG